jgi:putative ABC transport system permease protein
LALFTILLSSIAFVTLSVGGIGITNMMLVSVSERFREIGLRKALGATDSEIRIQFLIESIVVCAIAGFIGLIVGFFAYHAAIWAATKFVNKLEFEWIIDWSAMILSVFSIFIVGVLSGIFPALKAEKLQVIEALRSE